MSYLGTEYSPQDYYRFNSKTYINSQADAIKQILDKLTINLTGKAIDLGCGDGLVSKLLKNRFEFIGVDSSREMIQRYINETENQGIVGNFWDPLPKAEVAIASHSLHLCQVSRLHEARWRLKESGVKVLVVTSPFKTTGNLLKMKVLDKVTSKTNKGKTVWGFRISI